MARPQKKGMDYFPFDVGFFDDRKIKELRGKYGSDGITVYIYLLCLIYKENGYYVKIDDGFDYVASADLSMDSEKIGQIINFLCKRSLFENKLFMSDKVLTSHGIQLRFQEVVKSRATKKEIEVNEFWILDENETQSYIKCTNFQSLSEKNRSLSEKNRSLSIEKPLKEKESKVNKIKEKENKAEDLLHPTPELQKVLDVYNANMPPITGIILHSIDDYLKEVEADVIIYAITEAVKHDARTWSYVEAVINSNIAAGRVTLASVKEYAKKYRNNKSGLDVYDDKNLNYDELEQIMQSKM